MATEANIQEAVCLKKVEREEVASASETFEEKVTELPGNNQVKQLETSSLVATTVYTPLETGKPTDESGIFFQALSVTVIADEHGNTPESYKAAKPTEPEDKTIEIEEKAIESEVCGQNVSEKSEPEVGLKLLDSVEQIKKEAFSVSEKNQGDGEGDGVTSSQDAACEDVKETPEEHAAIAADFKEQGLNETPKEFVKEETDDKAVDAQEASEQSEIGSKDTEEQKYVESVEKIEQDEEIKPDGETEKGALNGLVQTITSDAYISTQTSQVETTEHEEKEQDVNVLAKDQDEDFVTRAQEVTFEGGLQEKDHHSEGNEHEVVKAKESIEKDADVCVSTQTALVKEGIKTEEPGEEKAIDPKKAELEEGLEISDSMAPSQKETLTTIEKDQGDSDGVTSSQESPCVDVEETTTVQHATTAIDFKEQDLNEKPREFIKEQTEDKSLDAQEASEECEKGAKEEIDQNPEESVKKIEKEEETAEIKPGAETEKTEHEEEDTNNDGLKEKSDSPSIEEVCEETGPEKDEYEKEVKDSAMATVTKVENEDEEKEQDVSVLDTDKDKDGVTSAQDVTVEKDLQEKNHHNEESIEKDTEVIKSGETTEQQSPINDLASDICVSTPTEPVEETTEKVAEETVERDDGQTKKSEEELLLSDSSSKALNENETVRKDEDQEKEQEIYVTEEVQCGGDDVTSSENASNEQEQHTEEIKPSVETTEEKDVCISKQTESQEKAAQNEESAIENDGDRKEKSDDPFVNEVCEANDLKKTEPEEEIKLADSSNVTTRESVDETKSNTEKQGVLNDITTDISSSTQTENIEETAASEENKDVETIKNDDGQTEKPESPLVEVLCETRSDISESAELVKQSDSFSMTLNEDETLGKEEKLEKEEEIKTTEIQGGGDDVTRSQTASNEEIKETTTGHHDTNVAYVEEGQGVVAVPKEILIEEAEDKSIEAEELEQPQNVEETQQCLSETISQNPEDEIKKEDKDLSHESVEDKNDDSTKEEKCTIEQGPVEEHNDQDEVSKEKVTDLEETKEVEPKEETISSTSLETSTEDTSNSEKEKAESEILPTEDLETGSEEQIPELVPKSEELVLKETDTHVDEEKGTVTKEISSAEKTEVQGDGDDVTSSQNVSNEDIQETIGQHDSTVTFVEEGQGVSAAPKEILIEEVEDKSIVAEEMPLELGQPNEQNVEEADSCLGKITTESPEDEIKKEDKDLSHESMEDTNDDIVKEEKCTLTEEPVEEHTGQDEVSKEEVTNSNGTEVEPQEEITPSTSLETSTEDTSISQEIKAEKETHEETIDNEEKTGEKVIEHEYEAVSREYDLKKKQEDVEETKMGEHATTNEEKDACISTQNESQEEPTKNEENAIEHDGDQKENSVNAVVKEVCEENDLTTTETQGRQLSDGFDVKTREVGVDEDTEENKSSEEPKENMEQQGELNVITSEACSSTQKETIEETTASEENNDVKTIENNDGQIEKPASPLDEVVCETTKSEIVESEEEVKQSDSFSTTLNENETPNKEEPEKEDEIRTSEVKGGGVDVASSEKASNEDIKETTIDQHNTTVVHVEEGHGVSALPKEILIEEAENKSIDAIEKSLEHGQHNEQNVEETHPCVSKIISEKSEEEIKKEDRDLSHESVEDTNDNTTKEEKCTLEHEPAEEHSAQDEVSKEKIDVEPQEVTPSISSETPTEVTSNSEKEKEESENFPKEDLKTVSVEQIPESVIRSAESVLKEECFIAEKDTDLDEEKGTIMEEIASDEKTEQTTEIKQETVKEVCEETSSEKTEREEGLNEKETITFKEDDQEVNTSAESQGEDNMTSSQKEVSEEKEILKEKNYHNDGNEGDFIESGEIVDEDTREIKSSVETKDTEHVITTSSSTQIEHDEETIEKKEKNDEEAIENDEKEIVSREETVEKKQEDIKETNEVEHATTVAYAEEEQSLSTITKEIIGEAEEDKYVFVQEKTEQYDGENIEKEQKAEEHDEEIKPSVETTEEKDVCISTQIEENTVERDGDQEENPDNPLVKEVCEEGDLTKTESEETQLSDSSNVTTREYVKEDTEETKSSDEIKENVEQQGVLNVITTDVSSSTQTQNVEKLTASGENNDGETIEHDEKPESPLVEVVCEERPEIVESEEVVKQSNSFSTTLNENEAQSKEEKLEKEDEIKTSEVEGDEVEVTSSHDVSNEDIKETTIDHAAHVEEEQGVRALPKVVLIEKAEDKSMDIEETSLEIGQPNEQNAEETFPCPTKSISDNPEDEIKIEDTDLSHESVEDTNDDIKEESRTLEHEPVEEHNDQDEVSKEKVTDLHETTEVEPQEDKVEPQEDITPSVSLETSTEDTSNSEEKKAEVETMPIEDLETVSEVQTRELVHNPEESVLKKECFISETDTHLDEEKEATTEKISSDEKTELTTEIKQETVKEVCEEISGAEVDDKSIHAQEASEQCENEAKDKIEQQPEESVNKPVSSYPEPTEGSIKEEQADVENNTKTQPELEAENQVDRTEYRTEMKDEAALTEKASKELEQTKEQNVEETEACLTEAISEKTEDNITKDEDLSHDSTEPINDNITAEEKCLPDVTARELEISTLEHEPIEEKNNDQDEVSKEKVIDINEPTAVEPQEDITPSSSLETSTDDTSNSDKAKAVSENLPLEDLESVSDVHVPDVMPESEDLKMKEECLVSETETYADEENRIATKEISSDENLEKHGSTQQPENSYGITEESVTQSEETGETNSLYENRDMKEEVTQENQLNSTEDCSKMEKDVILTKEVPSETEKGKGINDLKEQIVEEDTYSPELEEKSAQSQKEFVHEISNSDLIPVEKPEVTEVNVNAQIGQEDLQGTEDISCVPEVTYEARVKSVDLSSIESAAYPSESEKLATQAVDSDCDVQIPEVVADPEDSKVKEECSVLATTAENGVEEQDTKTNEISSAPDKEQEIVTKAPTESDEAKSSDLIMEEKALTKENLEIPRELEPTSEPVIEDQVTIETKPQPEQSDITSDNITDDQTSESKLEHTSAKDLEDGKGHIEEGVTLVPENETEGIENMHETTKNIILTDEVSVETEKEKEKDEIIGQVSEDEKCLTELDGTSTTDQKELTNEMEDSKLIPVENTEVTEVKAESQREIENIPAAEDLSCLSKASSVIETSKVEMHEDTEQTITVSEEVKDNSIDEAKDKIVPVPEDSKASKLQVNLPEIESTGTPSNGQDSMKPREDVSCVIQETTKEQGALTSQLADREILEEKDEEPISELQTFSEDQKSINESCIEEEVQSNLGVERKDDISGNKPVKEVTIDEVLLADEEAKESKSIKDTINEEAKLTQLTSDIDVCQDEKADSRPDELLETKQSVEDTEDAKFTAENLSVKDEIITVIEKSNDDSEVVASEFKRLEDTVTDKEKETLDKPLVDDSKTIYDPILSSTKQDTEVRSEESRDHTDMLEVKEITTGYSEIATEVVETAPERKEASAILADNLPEASPEMLLAKPEDKIADVVSNVECSRSEPQHLDTKEATLEFINQENQSGQTKEADESIKDVIPVEVVKTSTREPEVGSVDLGVPSMDATADKANNKTLEVHEAGEKILKDDEHLKSTCDESKPIEEDSGTKQEPLELDATRTLDTAATEDFKISQKYVPDDLIKVSQTHAEIPTYEVPACTVDKLSPNEPHAQESTEGKILTEKINSSHEQAEPVARSWTPEAGNLKVNTTVSVDQKEKHEPVEPAKIVLHEPAKGASEGAENLIGEKDSALTKDQQVEKEETVKTDEEYEEEDNEEDETMGSCSDAPVMVEASKDMEVKAPKKSHNILSGVGSKVKHSIAKVKKAITGKSSSPTKSTSPKAKTQLTG